jgi:uncharacterized membrane protein YgdD (TMEM256/DUF423 family)
MRKTLFPFWSALSGAISVSVLALSAHSLPKYLSNLIVNAVTTASELLLFHSILLVFLFTYFNTNKKIVIASKIIFAGSLIFAVSIYVLALNSILMLSVLKIMGPITPIGGILMITGWGLLAIQLLKVYYKKGIQ